MTIDITKTYKTRDGRAVTGLRRANRTDGWADEYTLVGDVDGSQMAWTADGRFFDISDGIFPEDLVLADAQPSRGLITPDLLAFEYGAFVAAVRINFAAGTFATATPEEFDAWLQSLTPSLAR